MSIESLHRILRIAPGCDVSDHCPRGISEHFLNISPAVSVGAQWHLSCLKKGNMELIKADKAVTQNIYFTLVLSFWHNFLSACSSLRFRTQKFVNRSGLEKLCSCTGDKSRRCLCDQGFWCPWLPTGRAWQTASWVSLWKACHHFSPCWVRCDRQSHHQSPVLGVREEDPVWGMWGGARHPAPASTSGVSWFFPAFRGLAHYEKICFFCGAGRETLVQAQAWHGLCHCLRCWRCSLQQSTWRRCLTSSSLGSNLF